MRNANKIYSEKHQTSLLSLKVLISICFLLAVEKPLLASLSISKIEPPLTAIKGKKSYQYKKGEYLRITYGVTEKKIAGRLWEVLNDSVMLVVDEKKSIIQNVAIVDISSISILHRKVRKRSLIEFAICITFIPLVINLSIGIFFNGLWWITYVFFLLLGTISLASIYLGSFLFDKYSTKKTEKGWKFESMVIEK
ncbi:MAG: hypothetical protein FGM61_06125 [Sediminibacterium sp.]|nr:hypothetical protein [Sediminibacterium sp.]